MKHLVLVFVLACSFIGCDSGAIAPAEAKTLVQQGALLIDVRTPDEFDVKHLDGAINIPVDQLEARAAELPKDKDLILYCRSGTRSAQGRTTLSRSGFSRVHDLGAMKNWK